MLLYFQYAEDLHFPKCFH